MKRNCVKRTISFIMLMTFVITSLTACKGDNKNISETTENGIFEEAHLDASEDKVNADVQDKNSLDENGEKETAPKDIIYGDERFDEYLPLLQGKKIALFTNQSAVLGGKKDGEHILDALMAEGINVSLIFSPEHGFRGELDAGKGDNEQVDRKSGVKVSSVYREGAKIQPSEEDMDSFDILVADIQDVGARFFTYYITLSHLMEACAKEGKKVIVLDRPDPNGFYVDGPILEEGFTSDVGQIPIPVVHGMTIGELSKFMNGEGCLDTGRDSCDLTVIACENYDHSSFAEINTPPSPNLRSMESIYLYPSLCAFENTIVSVGRGTDKPFEIFGSPYFKDVKEYDKEFTPSPNDGASNPPFDGKTCYGQCPGEKSLEELRKGYIDYSYLIDAYNNAKSLGLEKEFFGKADKKGRFYIDLLFGTDKIRKMVESGESVSSIRKSYESDIKDFLDIREKYLLYDDFGNSEKAEAVNNERSKAESMIKEMTLEKKIAQMMIPAVRNYDNAPFTRINDAVAKTFEECCFGGVIFFAGNIESEKQIAELIYDLQKANQKGGAGIGLFTAIDQEGGAITRLNMGTQMPGNMALCATGDKANAFESAKVIGSELSQLGFNLDFAPDMDVNSNPDNPIIGIRSFSDDPKLVSEYGNAYIEGLHSEKILASVKHFPGHGDTQTDSHTGLPCVNSAKEDLEKRELYPFVSSLENTDMVMTAHIQFPAVETGTYISRKTGKEINLPATVSRTILTDILRNEYGYKGIIVTDALDMGAVADHFDKKDLAKMAINAGADMLLIPVNIDSASGCKAAKDYIDMIADMVRSGEIDEKTIDESVTRILTLKLKYDISSDPKPVSESYNVGSKKNHDTEWEIAKKAVTLLKNDNDILPLSKDEKVLCLCPSKDQVNSFDYAGKLIGVTQGDTICYEDKNPSAAKSLLSGYSKVIVISRLSGKSDLDPNSKTGKRMEFVKAVLEEAKSKGIGTVLLSCQLPYDTALYDANAIIACYNHRGMNAMPEGEDIQEYGSNIPAAIYTIFGGNKPAGRLPVNVPSVDENNSFTKDILYERGSGLSYNY
ncbi:MAG: DUF1343 domain-containing protein [Butyrivibrio sp.]|nr:DUF1343 domain-containing protein [Butyrivibrio sp.]